MVVHAAGGRYDVLVIVGPQRDESSLEYGIVLANDEDSYQQKKSIPRFLTHALRVPRIGEKPGEDFYAQAEKQWGRTARFLDLPWGNIEHVAHMEAYERTRGVYLLRLDQHAVSRIMRAVKDHDWIILARSYFLKNIERYYSRVKPDTRPYHGRSHMLYSEHELICGVLKRAWTVAKLAQAT